MNNWRHAKCNLFKKVQRNTRRRYLGIVKEKKIGRGGMHFIPLRSPSNKRMRINTFKIGVIGGYLEAIGVSL